MSNNTLISAAMLNVLWEQQHTDVIDLLVPLVAEAVGQTTRVNERIDRRRIREALLRSLGYDDIPIGVIDISLKRLAREGKVSASNKGFVLCDSLADDLTAFEKRRSEIKRRQEGVGLALSNYLETHSARCNKLDSEAALNELVCFLSRNGMRIYRYADSLELLSRKKGELDYHIAQFILREKVRQSSAFDDIVALIRGSFVSAVLYLQAENLNIENASFKQTRIYIDAPVMLNILDLNLPEETSASRQALTMLVNAGAKVACFRHTVSEVRGILGAYMYSISKPAKPSGIDGDDRIAGPTLRGLDRRRVSAAEVQSIMASLNATIEKHGVSIVDASEEMPAESAGIGEAEFKETLLKRIHYRKVEAATRDAQSAAAICALRGGRRSSDIETCGHLFATANPLLCHTVNSMSSERREGHVPPMMTINDITAIVWLKGSAANADFPAKRLIENAVVALEPDADMLNRLFEIADNMEARGGINTEEAQAIRARMFNSETFMELTEGNVSNIDETTIESLANELRVKYAAENESALRLANQKVLTQETELREKSEEITAMRHMAVNMVRDAGQIGKRRIERVGRLAIWIILLAMFAIAVSSAIASLAFGQHANPVFVIALILISIVGFYDATLGKKKVLFGLLDRLAARYADWRKDAVRRQLNGIIDSVSNSTEEGVEPFDGTR